MFEIRGGMFASMKKNDCSVNSIARTNFHVSGNYGCCTEKQRNNLPGGPMSGLKRENN